ncbi:tripartite tricarboxylate transporter permease [Hominifimenecus sp. rT4P-3]|uniref:tripartite tricarboxylate transporter permease n=1 Tax=Hominifimenecus sp. rT4P-3 TaxID=3242979 RepID=UPI003DA2C558
MEFIDVMFQSPELLLYLAAGVFVGIYVGAIPGLSCTMAVSLLISFTFSWEILPAMAVMVGVHIGGVYGGSRSAILLNIPGAPAAVATALDGYPLAKKGQAGKAIGVTVVQSVFGGMIGVLFLALGAPALSKVALSFSSFDYMLLALMGLLLVGSLGNESMARGLFAVAIGIFIGTIGLDMVTGRARFTFGNIYLSNGVNYVVVMIGLFGMSEALMQLRDLKVKPVKQDVDKIVPGWKNVIKYMPLSIRTSLIGVFVGALPGTGGDIAALISYDHAKRTTKNPEVPFGEGAIEGLVAPESSNNAAIGGAYIPMLTLGIPGDATSAVMLGAMYVHGLQPGPLLMDQSADVFHFIIGSGFIANVFLLIFGFMGIKLFTKIVEMPKYVLMPAIIIFSVVGAFSINNSVADVYWMMGFGIVGYLMKLNNIPVSPVILGVILSSLMETNFRRGMSIANNSVGGFFACIFTEPIACVLALVILVMLFSQSGVVKKWRKKKAA